MHDPDGSGSQTATSQYFVYDGADLSMTFGNSGELRHRYLYGPQTDQVLVDEAFETVDDQTFSDEVLWLLADHQGSIRNVVDDNGVLRNRIEYDSFGNILDEGVPQTEGGGSTVEAIDQLFYFTGREFDKDAQLQNNRGRWYDAHLGRFLSEDPAFDDVNLYRYAGNSPVLYVDPTGLFTQLPTSYLPALAGNVTGFGRGTASPTALDLAYSNFNSPTATSSWNAVGNALGNAAYSAAKSYVSPVTRAAVGAGTALASTAVVSDFPGNPYHPQPRRQYDPTIYNGFIPELTMATMRFIEGATEKVEDAVIYVNPLTFGMTREEAALATTKRIIRATGQEVYRSDEWFKAQPGFHVMEGALGMAANPLTYTPLVEAKLANLRLAGGISRTASGEAVALTAKQFAQSSRFLNVVDFGEDLGKYAPGRTAITVARSEADWGTAPNSFIPSGEKTFLQAHDPRVRPWYDPGAEHVDHPVARVFEGQETRTTPAAMNLRKGGLEGELRKYENYLIRNGMKPTQARQVIANEIESLSRDVNAAPFSNVFKKGFTLNDIDQ